MQICNYIRYRGPNLLLTAYMLCIIARHFMIMDNQNNHVNTFINNQNLTETNDLTCLLGNDKIR